MIQSFADKEAAKIWEGGRSRRLPADIQSRAFEKLFMIHSATVVEDLRIPPSNRLELLKGDRKDQFSIRINQQWRICFTFENGNASNVEITDYHS